MRSPTLTLAAAFVLGAPAVHAQTPSALDSVTQAGVLRARTPGDYKPCSFQKTDGAYEGIDVDLALGLCAIGDGVMKAYVDQWLHLSNASGDYQRVVDKWLR